MPVVLYRAGVRALSLHGDGRPATAESPHYCYRSPLAPAAGSTPVGPAQMIRLGVSVSRVNG